MQVHLGIIVNAVIALLGVEKQLPDHKHNSKEETHGHIHKMHSDAHGNCYRLNNLSPSGRAVKVTVIVSKVY